MSWTNALWSDKKKEDGSGDEKKSTTVTPQPGTPAGNQPLPGLNFPVIMATPPATPHAPNEPILAPIEPVVPAPDATPVAPEPLDPLTERLVVDLGERVRKDAGVGYKQFNAMRLRMTDAARGTILPLDIILAAANVKPTELVEEVRVLEGNLAAAVAELDGDISAKETAETADLQREVEDLQADLGQKSSRIQELTEELGTLRREAGDASTQLNAKNNQIRAKQTEARSLRARLKAARSRVAAQLADEKRTFLNR